MHKIKDIRKGDLLTFKATDDRYKLMLCTSTYTDKSPHNYTFAALTFDSESRPRLDDLKNWEFYGVGNTKNDFFKYSDSELKKIWTVHPEVEPYFLGSYGLIIWRKDFMKFRDQFEKIGNLQIVAGLDKNGNGSVNASDIDYLHELFANLLRDFMKRKGQKKFKVSAILNN